MGITALWDLIKNEDRSVPIAQLAEDHFKRCGRPLRIAVDEADWRHNNLTAQQVYMIREISNQPAFQGIEKSMFYRICRLLTLNVQLMFVFDGPGRPWKRGGRGGGKIDFEKRKILKNLLRSFGIPYHEAPGEAEAECARLQQLGVVDAVFSQDSDTLMFGCNFLIRDDRVAKEKGNNDRSKENTKKSGTSVRVVYLDELREKHSFNREGLVLFAMLCGGDYDTKGLPGCGSSIAIGAVRAGLGTSLCQCRTRTDCMIWRDQLSSYFQTRRARSVVVPPDFPNIKTLEKYNRPKISADDRLLNLRNFWDAPIKELDLLEVTSSHFNIWGKLYMNWVGPVLLTKALVARDLTLPKQHIHQIKLTKQRAKKDSTQPPSPQPLRPLTFSPFGLTTLSQKDFEVERAGYWTSRVEDLFEPHYTVKAEIPTYLLQRALPPDMLAPPPAPQKTPSKRKRRAEDDAGSEGTRDIGTGRRQPTSSSKRVNTDRPSGSPPCLESPGSRISRRPEIIPVRRHEACVRPMSSQAGYIDLLSESEEDDILLQRRSSVVDLGDTPSDSEDEDNDLVRAIQLSLQEPDGIETTLLPSRHKQREQSGSEWRSRPVEPESLSFQPPLPMESEGTAIAGNSNISSRTYSAVGSSTGVGTSKAFPTDTPSAVRSSATVNRTESTLGTNTAEIRRARLRFFESRNAEMNASVQDVPCTKRSPSSQGPNRRPAPRSLPEDIEIIDLT